MIKLPGLIDAHVHLRDPGQTAKEDFLTGTGAALFGGFTTVLDMPNNLIPVTSEKRLNKKIAIARKKVVCDTGFYFGSLGDNLHEFIKVQSKVHGLKLFLNETTGNLKIGRVELIKIYKSWPGTMPILVHAEDDLINETIDILEKTRKKTHLCHVSSKRALKRVIQAKKIGLPITCGVTPHHLFLSQENADRLGSFGSMKPPVEKGSKEFLWENIKYVDVIESDHAPHTIPEKESENPPFGVPGLETTLPLLLTKLSPKEIIRLCFTNPRKIFNIPTDENTYIVVDENFSYTLENRKLKTKCHWSPFAGWKVKGKVTKVVIRGKTVMEDDKLLVKPGFGRII